MAASITTTRGDTLSLSYDLSADITGWTPTFTVKAYPGYASLADNAAEFSLTTGTGVTVTNAATGLVTVTVPAATMASLDPGDYAFDLQVKSGGTTRTALIDGEPVGILHVLPDVTRA